MKIYVAPMAGVTDYAFRQILKEYRPDLMYTEMVNASMLLANNDKTINNIMRISEDENTGIQLFGSDVEELFDAFCYLNKRGYKNLLLNMGCPKNKIVKKGAGSALESKVEDIDRLLDMLNNENIKISLKIRVSKYMQDYFDLANKYEIPFLCIHLRTKEEEFSEIIHIDKIEKLSRMNRKFDLIINGGIYTLEDYNKIKKYNIDGIMLARGVIGRPWLIQEIVNENEINMSLEDIKKIVIKHIKYIAYDKGECKASMEINKFLENYFSGLDVSEILLEKDYIKKIKLINKL